MVYGMTSFFLIALVSFFFTLRKRKDNEAIFDKASTTALKGILCVFIMLHNLGLDFARNNELSRIIASHSGTVAVSMFFFLSGYGLLTAYKKKGPKFLLKLIFHNCLKLYLVAVFINTVEFLCFFRNNFETKDLLLRIFNLDLFNNFNRMNRHGWFIATILGLYVVFAVVFFVLSRFKFKKSIYVATFIVVAIVVALKIWSKIADEGGMYTNGLPCFALGLLYSLYYDFVNKICKKGRIWIMIGCLIVSFISFFFLWGTLAGYLMNIFMIALSTKYRYDNKFTLFLGHISLGIYLWLHFSTLLLQPLVNNVIYWVIGNTILILILSILMHGIIDLFEVGINKFKNLFHKKSTLRALK